MPQAGAVPRPASGALGPAFGTLRASGLFRLAGWPHALGLVVLVGLYYGAAQLGYALNFTGPVAAIVWLPVGVGIAFLYFGGLHYWPGVLVGDLLANDYSALPIGSAMGQSCGNVLEVIVAVALLWRLVPDGAPLARVWRLPLLLLALAAGTALSATIGLLSLRLGGVVTTDALPKLWRTWWLGDLCGGLIVVPLALAWWRLPSREWLRQRAVEGVLVLIAIVTLSELATRTTRPVAYLAFPALILAAVRFGQRGATVAVAIAAGHAVWATTHYIGPFAYESIGSSVLSTQLYIAVASLSTLSLAALVSERDEFAGRLQASRERLVRAGDVERRRIERNLHDGAQQRLTALVVRLGIAADDPSLPPAQARAQFASAEKDLLVAIDELRELARGMHPPVLRRDGVAKAILALTTASTPPVEFVELAPMRFDDAAEETAYFVLVEAITNAQKHAGAATILVRTCWTGGLLEVAVVDDGVGGATESDGAGLQGLRDRVEAIGGRLDIVSSAGGGTRLTAAIPATVVSR